MTIIQPNEEHGAGTGVTPPTGPMAEEPATITGAIIAGVTALIALLVAFGITLDSAQQAAILGIMAVVAPLIAGAVIRGKVVSPNTAQQAVNKSTKTELVVDPMQPKSWS